MNEEKPYIERTVTKVIREYNPKFGDDRKCECGHSYHRHFDPYAFMEDSGCGYCSCGTFVEASPDDR